MKESILFTETRYDSVKDNKAILAKATILNLFLKLSALIAPTTKSNWFSFIDNLLIVNHERLIAIVHPEMGDIVRKVKNNISSFKEYTIAPASQHYHNMPPRFEIKRSDMFAIKSAEVEGNVHLTLAPAKDADGKGVLLLDAGMDENGHLWAHLAEFFGTKFSGSVHPFDIHEYLTLTYPNLVLGYTLVH